MKLKIRTEDSSWSKDYELDCPTDDHRHFAIRVGSTVRLNCETRGVLEVWRDAPLGGGSVVVELEAPKVAVCRRCGKKLAAGPTGTVHASSKRRSCY